MIRTNRQYGQHAMTVDDVKKLAVRVAPCQGGNNADATMIVAVIYNFEL